MSSSNRATVSPVSVFVQGLLERAVKSAAQSALAAYVGQNVDLIDGGWRVLGLAALTGFVLSVLTSIASQPVGNTDTPSLVPVTTSASSKTQGQKLEVEPDAPSQLALQQNALQQMDSIYPN